MTPRKTIGRGAAYWGQVAALIVAVVAVAGSLYFTQRQIDHLRDQTRVFTRYYAQLIGVLATDTTATSSGLDLAIDEMIAQSNFPYVVTDSLGGPLAGRGIGIEGDIRDAALMSRVGKRIRDFDEQYDPIPIGNPGAPQLFHYGDPPEVRRLRVLPFVQLGLMAVILALVWWSLRSRLERQRSLVWVGLARESAHQFGTPLSSLQGWLVLLRDRISGSHPAPAAAGIPAPAAAGIPTPAAAGIPTPAAAGIPGREEDPPIETIVESMSEDVERLGRITNRFAKLGGPPGNERVEMDVLVGRVVDYMRKRAPQRNATVVLEEKYEQVPPVTGQAELLEWVVENLLKNALDALGGQPGRIEVALQISRDGRSVQLRVGDDGAGIAPTDQRHIFDPGFSRKRRGWGLGLPLARRVVLAHGGRLSLVQSRAGEGSVFEVVLPAAEGVE